MEIRVYKTWESDPRKKFWLAEAGEQVNVRCTTEGTDHFLLHFSTEACRTRAEAIKELRRMLVRHFDRTVEAMKALDKFK